MVGYRPPRSIQFLGIVYETENDFRAAFPAYKNYSNVVRKGADTPHKIEVVIYERANRGRRNRAKNAEKYQKKPKKQRTVE